MTRRSASAAQIPSIRLATIEDASAILAIYAGYCTHSAITFEETPPSKDEMTRRVEQTLERFPWFVLEDELAVQAYAYASPHRDRAAYRWSVDTAVYVASHAHHRGFGKRLYGALLEVLRLMGYYRAYAGITLPNPASEGLHRSFGFVQSSTYHGVGYKLGAWRDVGWFELALQPAHGRPSEPLLLSQVVERPEFAHALMARG